VSSLTGFCRGIITVISRVLLLQITVLPDVGGPVLGFVGGAAPEERPTIGETAYFDRCHFAGIPFQETLSLSALE